MAVGSNEPVVGASEVRKLGEPVSAPPGAGPRALARPQDDGERDPARGAREGGGKKTDVAFAVAAEPRFPVSRVAEVLDVSRSQLHARASGVSRPRGAYHKTDDVELLPAIRRLVDQRPTYGYRRLTALAEPRAPYRGTGAGQPQAGASHPRPAWPDAGAIYRPPRGPRPRRQGRRHGVQSSLVLGRARDDLLERRAGPHRARHRPRTDGGRGSLIDAFDREIIAYVAVAGAGISGSDIRDMMLAAVERRFGTERVPHAIEHLSDNGSCYTARDTRDFATALGLVSCFTPVRSPESNGMSESFVKTLKRDYVRVTPLPDAATVLGLVAGWITDYTRSILTPRSACARLPSSAKRLTPAGLSGETGGTPESERSSIQAPQT